jgi:hypothetical protein
MRIEQALPGNKLNDQPQAGALSSASIDHRGSGLVANSARSGAKAVSVSPAHSPLQNLRLKSRAIRVNPEGPGAAQVCGEWPRSITAMITKNKNTEGIRDNAGRNMDAILISCICPKNEARASPGVSRSEENYSVP